MMAAADVSDVSRSCVLRHAVEAHRSELVQSLHVSTLFLTYLAKHQIIEPADILKYEHYSEAERRASDLLDKVVAREETVGNCYNKFLDALRRSDQQHLAAMLTSIDQELRLVDEYQDVLQKNLEEIHNYLATESRRTEVRYTTISPEYKRPSAQLALGVTDTHMDNNGVAEFLYKVHQSTKSTLVHFDRCREVIDKLHSDCEVVAKRNGDMLDKLRECASQVGKLLPSALLSDQEAPLAAPEQTSGDELNDVKGTEDMTLKSKETESETLVDLVRSGVDAALETKGTQERDEKLCQSILANITADVRKRLLVLDKYNTASLPRHQRNKYIQGIIIPSPSDSQSKTRQVVMELAEVLEEYVHKETQLSHQHTLGTLRSTAGSSPRNFDQIEHDMMHLSKEIRRKDQEHAAALLRQITEATRSEREDCLRVVDEISRSLRAHRKKLQEQTPKNATKKRHVSKKRIRRTMDTSFGKKLSELSSEMDSFVDTQTAQVERHRENSVKQKLETDKEMRFKTGEIRELQARLKETELERDKFQKLYHQIQAIRDSNVLTRATIPKRVTQNQGSYVRVHKFPPLYPHLENTSQSVPLADTGTETRLPSHSYGNNRLTRQTQGLARQSREPVPFRRPVRPGYIAGRGPPVSGKTPLAVKPRLTPRAKHLTKLKATVKERQRQVARAGPGIKLQYTLNKQ